MAMPEMHSMDAPKMAHTNHDEYYHKLKAESCSRIRSLFETNGTNMGEVIHKTKIEDADDIEILMAFVFEHGSAMEKAHMWRYGTDWLHACHELHEHKEG